MRTHKSVVAIGLSVILIVTVALAQQKSGSRDERAIRDAATAWAKAASDKDLDKTVSFYADDAHMYPFNAPMTATKEDIRKVWTDLLSTPGGSLSVSTSKVEVAKSGDIAYETGTFELSQNDAQGQPAKTPGKYVVVWKKQAGGQWKAVADIFNTDK